MRHESAFYVPRSNPDGYSVNVRCLDPATVETVDITPLIAGTGNSTLGAGTPVEGQRLGLVRV
jgi:hypothetical protein